MVEWGGVMLRYRIQSLGYKGKCAGVFCGGGLGGCVNVCGVWVNLGIVRVDPVTGAWGVAARLQLVGDFGWFVGCLQARRLTAVRHAVPFPVVTPYSLHLCSDERPWVGALFYFVFAPLSPVSLSP